MFVLVYLLPDEKIDRIRGTFEILPVRQRIYFFERPDQTRGVAVIFTLVHSWHGDLNTALLVHLHVRRGSVLNALMDVADVAIASPHCRATRARCILAPGKYWNTRNRF